MQLLPVKEDTRFLHVCRLRFLKVKPIAPIERFARLHAVFFSSEGFHRTSQIFNYFMMFMNLFDSHGIRSMYASGPGTKVEA